MGEGGVVSRSGNERTAQCAPEFLHVSAAVIRGNQEMVPHRWRNHNQPGRGVTPPLRAVFLPPRLVLLSDSTTDHSLCST